MIFRNITLPSKDMILTQLFYHHTPNTLSVNAVSRFRDFLPPPKHPPIPPLNILTRRDT